MIDKRYVTAELWCYDNDRAELQGTEKHP